MTSSRRRLYLLERGWYFYERPSERWYRGRDPRSFTFLGAFMRQQAADARAEREAELADMQNLQEGK